MSANDNRAIELRGASSIEAPSVSRRSFIGIAVGTISMLPAVSGGFALAFAPSTAHADDSTSPDTEIVIAKPNEAGFAVADVTGNKRTPVEGARVTIRSNENKKTVSGETGKNGVFLADLGKIATPKKNAQGVEIYRAEASITVEKEGYRVFETGWMSLKGGTGFDVPTRKIGSEPAYPKRATLSDWDVLYTNNEFTVTPANDAAHAFEIAFCTKSTSAIEAKIVNVKTKATIAKGKVKPQAQKDSEWKTATISFKGSYLKKGHRDALPAGAQLRLDYSIDGKGYSVPLRLKVTVAPAALSKPSGSKMTFAPFGDDDMKLSVRMPAWVPLVGGKQVALWRPDLPIDVRFDPYGYFRASLRTSEWGYKSKNGKVDGNAWKKLPRKSFEDQFTDTYNEMSSYAMKTAAYMINGSRSTFSAFPANKSLKLAFSAEAAIAGKWNEKEGLIRGKGQLRGMVTFAFSISKQLFAGPVPFILQFDLDMVAGIGVGCGVVIPYKEKWGKWQYDYTNTGASFTLYISPALSVGIGIKGVASVSLQGVLSFSLYVGVGPLPKGGKQKNPHYIIGLNAVVRVVVQLLFFTMPFKIWDYNKPQLYDSWDPEKLNQQSDLGTQAAIPSFGEWFAENPPEEMDLGDNLAEFAGEGFATSTQALSGQSAEELAERLRPERKVEEHLTDDGMAYQIMTLAPVSDSGLKAHAPASANGGAFAAATLPGLEPQNASLQPQATAAEYQALAKGHGYAWDALQEDPGKLKLANNIGMAPGTKQCIAKNVLSDPRIKIVSLYGKAVMFRIAAVKVNGQIRTRVVAQVLQTAKDPAGPLCVVDFNPQIWNSKANGGKGGLVDRNDLWDYDFDVVVLTNLHSSYQSVQFLIISGVRADGAKIGQIATDQVFQHVRTDFTNAEIGEQWPNSTAQGVWASDFKFDKSNTFPYHNFSCPHIEYAADYPSEDAKKNEDYAPSGELLLTFLDRAATKPELVMSDDAKNVHISVGFCSTSTIASSVDVYKLLMFDLAAMTAGHQDATVFELVSCKRLRKNPHCGYNVITLRGSKTAYHYRLLTTTFHQEGKENKRTRIMEAKLWHTSTHDGFLDDEETHDLMKLVDWPNHENTFLAAVDGKLQSVKLTVDKDGSIKPAYTEVGPDNFAISSFGVDPTGTLLYYPTVSEGSPGFKYESPDSVSKITSKPLPKIDEHRIMACRLRNGKFSDPFAFAEVNYDMDDLNVVNVSSDSVGFLSTDVIDPAKGQANLYYTTMPFVKCANIIGCEAVSTFAYPNTDALFNLTVRNDGNTYITGFTAQLVEKGSNKVESSKELVFSAETLQESNYNPKENGKLKDVESDFALAPGKTSIYQVALTIPEGWQGTKHICVKSTDVVIAPVSASIGSVAAQAASALSAQADEDASKLPEFVEGDVHESYSYDDSGAYEYVVGTNDDDYDDDLGEPTDVLRIDGKVSFFEDDDYDDNDEGGSHDLQLGDAPIEEVDEEDDESKRDLKKSGSSSTTRTVPGAADSLGQLPGLLGAASIAGAALAAYSSRRVANEREAD